MMEAGVRERTSITGHEAPGMGRSMTTKERLRAWWLAMFACLMLLLPAVVRPVLAASPAGFVVGTDFEDATFSGRWLRLIYFEAFKRLGLPLDFAVFPTVRLGVEADEGRIDGEAVRVHAYADAHPNLVRVEESVLNVDFLLYTANPVLHLGGLEDLPASGLLGEYRRGVLLCERTLKKWLPAAQVSDVASTEQGLKKLLARRTDLFCELDNAMLTVQAAPEFRGAAKIRKLVNLNSTLPLYPYLHKKNAALAPRLAAILQQMKSEGLIERYRIETEREFGIMR